MNPKSSDLNLCQRVALETLWVLCRVFGMLPNFVHYYIVAPFVYFVIYKVIRYRVKVVDENLSYAFADKSEAERKEIRRNFYVTLSEVFVSTVAIASPRYKGDDKNDLQSEAAKFRESTKDENWIGLTAHIGLWEHFMFWGEYSGRPIVGAYHKLKSKVVDELFIRLRTRNHPNVVAVERKQTVRFCMKNRDGIEGRKFGLGLLADQNPTKYANCVWIDFLGRETIFFDGGEKLALKLGWPVYFVCQKRVGRGQYKLSFDTIYDGKESVEPFEITRRYIRRLEVEIRQHPELWLWSHRRWKHKRD